MYKFFFVLAFALISCSPPHYTFISPQKLAEEAAAKSYLPIKRYVVLPAYDFFSDDDPLFDLTVKLINENRWQEVKKALQTANKHDPSFPLCNGLCYLKYKDYPNALANFNNYKGETHKCLCQLLIIDCQYELSRPNADIKKLLGEYQKALDCSNTEINRIVIQQRIKYLRYE